MCFRILRSLVLLLSTIAAVPSFADTVVYSQARLNDYGGGGNFSGLGYKVADSFHLTTTATVNNVSWYGSNGLTPSLDTFTVKFFADDAGIPGQVLATNIVGTGNPIALIPPPLHTVDYLYDAYVVPITFVGGTKYWIEIYDALGDDNWAWEPGTLGDNEVYEDASNYPGGRSYLVVGEGDNAFSLNNVNSVVVTPEPSRACYDVV